MAGILLPPIAPLWAHPSAEIRRLSTWKQQLDIIYNLIDAQHAADRKLKDAEKYERVFSDADFTCKPFFKMLYVPFLRYPVLDGSADFVLQTDASGTALGAVLYQETKSEKWVITYNSQILKEDEKKWSATERECLAIVYGLKLYKHYSIGHKVTIRTDHKPLLAMKVNSMTDGKLKRWYSFIAQFNYKLEYVPGKQNAMADFLSRMDEPDDQTEKIPPKWENMFSKNKQISEEDNLGSDIEQVNCQLLQRLRSLTDRNPDGTDQLKRPDMDIEDIWENQRLVDETRFTQVYPDEATLVRNATDEKEARILFEYLAEASVAFPRVFPVVHSLLDQRITKVLEKSHDSGLLRAVLHIVQNMVLSTCAVQLFLENHGSLIIALIILKHCIKTDCVTCLKTLAPDDSGRFLRVLSTSPHSQNISSSSSETYLNGPSSESGAVGDVHFPKSGRNSSLASGSSEEVLNLTCGGGASSHQHGKYSLNVFPSLEKILAPANHKQTLVTGALGNLQRKNAMPMRKITPIAKLSEVMRFGAKKN